jgi:hypothetical protein
MDRPDEPIRVPDWSLTNTDALLTEIGFAESKIKDLRERGIIG